MKIVKRLLKCVREYRRDSIVTPVLIIFEVLLECILPLITSSLINTIQNLTAETMPESESVGFIKDIQTTIYSWSGGDGKISILIHGALLIGIAIISLMCGVFAGKTAANASAGFGKNLRKDIFYNIQTFSFANIDKYSAPGLVTRLTTDVANVQNSYMMVIRTGIRAPLMLIISLAISFSISVTISLITFGVMFLLVVIGSVLVLKVMPIFKRVFKKYDKLNRSVQENVKAMRVVKAFVREEHEKEKFGEASTDLKNDFTKAEKIVACVSPLMSTVMYIVMLSVIFVGALIVMRVIQPFGDNFQIGEMTSLLQFAMQTLFSLMMLSAILVTITISLESSKRIYEVLGETSTLQSPENAITEVKDGSITFENVDFKYSETAARNALENINLTIESGETVGILGGTGSAKSSLVQLIPRLYDVTNGKVTVGGEDVKNYDLTVLRDSVSMVLQKNVLFSGTIKENLKWGNKEATDEEIKRAAHLACADGFIENFPDGYETHIEQGGTNVSGGQRQRLCIARALLKNPKILILDDSTSAVDTRTDAEIRRAFKLEIPSVTKIIIAQRIASVIDADKIIVMDGGKISAIGKHDELMKTSEIYREVYTSQVKKEA